MKEIRDLGSSFYICQGYSFVGPEQKLLKSEDDGRCVGFRVCCRWWWVANACVGLWWFYPGSCCEMLVVRDNLDATT